MLVAWQESLNVPTSIPLHFVAVQQMAIEEQSNKKVSDMEVQRCANEFHHEKKNCTH